MLRKITVRKQECWLVCEENSLSGFLRMLECGAEVRARYLFIPSTVHILYFIVHVRGHCIRFDNISKHFYTSILM